MLLISVNFDKFIVLYIRYWSIRQNSFTTLKKSLVFYLFIELSPHDLLATTDLCTILEVLSFPECQICGILQYVAFSDQLFSLSDILLSFVNVFVWFHSALLLIAKEHLYECPTICLFIPLLKAILIITFLMIINNLL